VSRYLGASPGVVVAVDLPPGPAWLDVVDHLRDLGAAVLPLDRRLSDLERRAIVDLARPASLLSEDDEVLFADPAPIDLDVGLVMATSGTGGRPKLVELSRAAISSAVGLSFGALGPAVGRVALEPSDPWVCCLTPAHIGGMLVLLRGLLLGSPLTVLEGFDVQELLERAPDGAHVALVPTMARRLADAGADLSHLGVLLVGGGPLEPNVARDAAAHGGRVVATYGLTETCGGIVYDGRLFEDTAVRLGPQDEVEVRGPTVMNGYRHDPAATADAFTLDGWLRTGDVGELDEDASLVVRGRLDEAIRTGAETVWPEEVEAALRDHPKVADVAVAGRPDPKWGERVVAFVVSVKADDPPALEELRDHAADRIARFKAPRTLVLVPSLPRGASGKLRRGSLPG
jgi:O-succinylbenzoic acid--CoA ligase